MTQFVPGARQLPGLLGDDIQVAGGDRPVSGFVGDDIQIEDAGADL